MRFRKKPRHFRRRMFLAIGCILVFTFTLLFTRALAFCPSSIASYGRNFQAKIRARGVQNKRKCIGLNIHSKNDHARPIHVLSNYYRPQDNLFSGISEIGMGFSIGVLYSEYFIIMTGCGAPNFGDTLERICYLGVIVYSGLALFNRIVTFGSGLDDTLNNIYGPLQPATLWQVRVVEYLSFAAVVGAIVALQVQYTKGASMDGLSGIDINMCRAIRGDF